MVPGGGRHGEKWNHLGHAPAPVQTNIWPSLPRLQGTLDLRRGRRVGTPPPYSLSPTL